MVRIPILMVNEGRGIVGELELEARPGDGRLYVDGGLFCDEQAHAALRTAFSLLRADRDVLIRRNVRGEDVHCLCGASLGLAVYLGMYALLNGCEIAPNVFVTGGLDGEGKVTAVGGLAEKMRTVVDRAKRLIVPAGQGLPLAGIEVVEVSTVEEAVHACFSDGLEHV